MTEGREYFAVFSENHGKSIVTDIVGVYVLAYVFSHLLVIISNLLVPFKDLNMLGVGVLSLLSLLASLWARDAYARRLNTEQDILAPIYHKATVFVPCSSIYSLQTVMMYIGGLSGLALSSTLVFFGTSFIPYFAIATGTYFVSSVLLAMLCYVRLDAVAIGDFTFRKES